MNRTVLVHSESRAVRGRSVSAYPTSAGNAARWAQKTCTSARIPGARGSRGRVGRGMRPTFTDGRNRRTDNGAASSREENHVAAASDQLCDLCVIVDVGKTESG